MESKTKFNLKHSGVKRIMQEIKELESQPSTQFIAKALEEDMFEWHFVLRGPPDTDFEGGVYHGRILLPADYPFKPPSFMMLTPSGRFQTNTKICLSISSHHPENWQPSWSVRTALTALIAFMPTPGAGAVGSLDFPSEDRKALALRSRLEVPKFGSAERQRVINDMHQQMLDLEMPQEAEGISESAITTQDASLLAAELPTTAPQSTANTARSAANIPPINSAPDASPSPHSQAATPLVAAASATPSRTSSHSLSRTTSVAQQTTQSAGDRGLAALAVALSVAIAAILLKKVVVFMMVQPAGFSS